MSPQRPRDQYGRGYKWSNDAKGYVPHGDLSQMPYEQANQMYNQLSSFGKLPSGESASSFAGNYGPVNPEFLQRLAQQKGWSYGPQNGWTTNPVESGQYKTDSQGFINTPPGSARVQFTDQIRNMPGGMTGGNMPDPRSGGMTGGNMPDPRSAGGNTPYGGTLPTRSAGGGVLPPPTDAQRRDQWKASQWGGMPGGNMPDPRYGGINPGGGMPAPTPPMDTGFEAGFQRGGDTSMSIPPGKYPNPGRPGQGGINPGGAAPPGSMPNPRPEPIRGRQDANAAALAGWQNPASVQRRRDDQMARWAGKSGSAASSGRYNPAQARGQGGPRRRPRGRNRF